MPNDCNNVACPASCTNRFRPITGTFWPVFICAMSWPQNCPIWSNYDAATVLWESLLNVSTSGAPVPTFSESRAGIALEDCSEHEKKCGSKSRLAPYRRICQLCSSFVRQLLMCPDYAPKLGYDYDEQSTGIPSPDLFRMERVAWKGKRGRKWHARFNACYRHPARTCERPVVNMTTI
jgi:hypothetical protein